MTKVELILGKELATQERLEVERADISGTYFQSFPVFLWFPKKVESHETAWPKWRWLVTVMRCYEDDGHRSRHYYAAL